MSFLQNIHHSIFSAIERIAGDWFLPTLARFAFATVLAGYFWQSAITKLGEGFFGFLNPSTGAYISILGEETLVAYDFDTANVPFFYDLIVYAGTWAEFILPALIIVGLFTRIAALGMVGFVAVQTFVDLTVHKVGAETIGAWFDRDSASAIMDQRTLWFVLLSILIVKGAGALSLDRLLAGKPS
ncbi:DoxX family protein [Pseudahrensia aquimaris]|uniref:DoxX family protein n=1 Tax=Pseudahrensia aquimaris TaxID=744461 RepID=A0ABW3FHQ9_9HYPH